MVLFSTITYCRTYFRVEKKRHMDTNNQIIMSNVKYQQALHQAHALVQKYTREKDEYMRKELTMVASQVRCLNSRGCLLRTRQAEADAIKLQNAKLMDLLAVRLEENGLSKGQPLTNKEKKAKKEIPATNTAKDLHSRLDSPLRFASLILGISCCYN